MEPASTPVSYTHLQKGLLALPSIGMSPGWTSLCAQYMMDRMDEVHDVVIRWGDYVDTDAFFAPISPAVLVREWFGSSPVCTLCGKQADVDLLESGEEFSFPMPIGTQTVYTVTSHPDIVLIPRFAGKPIRRCEEKGGVFHRNRSMEQIWLEMIRRAAKEPMDGNTLDALASTLIPPLSYAQLLEQGCIRDHAVCFSCEVTGIRQQRPVRHICYYTSTLEQARRHLPWASPAVYGTVGGMPVELVLMLGRGELSQTGVRCVAELDVIERLNRAMANRGQILTERIEQPMEA